jgi:quercetin dioxygenase-like cupin family protein
MNKITRTATCLTFLAVMAGLAAAQEPTFPINLDGLKYNTNPLVPGVETAFVMGSPLQPGLYTTHARVSAGAKVPPHTHPNTLTTWVTSGTAYVGTGTKLDESALKAYPAGTFFVTPAGSPHFIVAKDGPFSILDHGVGPSAFNIIKQD